MKKKFYGALLLGSLFLQGGVWYLALITMMTLTL